MIRPCPGSFQDGASRQREQLLQRPRGRSQRAGFKEPREGPAARIRRPQRIRGRNGTGEELGRPRGPLHPGMKSLDFKFNNRRLKSLTWGRDILRSFWGRVENAWPGRRAGNRKAVGKRLRLTWEDLTAWARREPTDSGDTSEVQPVSPRAMGRLWGGAEGRDQGRFCLEP